MSIIKQYKEHLQAINDLVATHGNEIIEEAFKELFDQYDHLDAVFVYGYTPGFNDGDPCTHRQYAETDPDEMEGYLEENCEGEFDEDVRLNEDLSGTQAGEIQTTLSNLGDLFERILDTDYYIFAKRNDDSTIELNIGEYECGY